MRASLSTIAVLLTATAFTTATAGAAPTRHATDHIAGLRFTLSGASLQLKITAHHRNRRVAAGTLLRGHRVKVTCGTNNASGQPNSPLVARGAGFWSRRSQGQSFTLSRDVAAKASWCLVQAGGHVASFVDLKLGHNPSEVNGK